MRFVVVFIPQVRGCFEVRDLQAQRERHIYPAGAGMFRLHMILGTKFPYLSRRCGDDSFSSDLSFLATVVYPAYAGMIRASPILQPLVISFYSAIAGMFRAYWLGLIWETVVYSALAGMILMIRKQRY